MWLYVTGHCWEQMLLNGEYAEVMVSVSLLF